VLNSGLRKFRHGISIVETCYQLSSRKVDAHSVINWTVVGQRDNTTIVYRTDRQALSTARFCRTGQLAIADTWFRTCTSSFCTAAWQLARFQLIRRIARSSAIAELLVLPKPSAYLDESFQIKILEQSSRGKYRYFWRYSNFLITQEAPVL